MAAVGWNLQIAIGSAASCALCWLAVSTAEAQVFSDPRPVPKPRSTPTPTPRPTSRSARPAPKLVVPPMPAVVASPYVGAVPRATVGEWSVTTSSGGFLSTDYLDVINIVGGQPGQIIGRIDYYSVARGLQPSFACSSVLRLEAVTNDVVVTQEVIERKSLFCPGGKRLAMQVSNGQMWVTWTKVGKKSEKVTMQGWAQRTTR